MLKTVYPFAHTPILQQMTWNKNMDKFFKLLILSYFSICHNVFTSRLLQRRRKASVCVKGLTKPVCTITVESDTDDSLGSSDDDDSDVSEDKPSSTHGTPSRKTRRKTEELDIVRIPLFITV